MKIENIKTESTLGLGVLLSIGMIGFFVLFAVALGLGVPVATAIALV